MYQNIGELAALDRLVISSLVVVFLMKIKGVKMRFTLSIK